MNQLHSWGISFESKIIQMHGSIMGTIVRECNRYGGGGGWDEASPQQHKSVTQRSSFKDRCGIKMCAVARNLTPEPTMWLIQATTFLVVHRARGSGQVW